MKSNFYITDFCKRLSLLTLVFLCNIFSGNAQQLELDSDAVTEAKEDATEEEPTNEFLINASIDGYYQYSFQESAFPTSFTEVHNGFMLGMANLVFTKTTDKIEMVVDLGFGPRAEVANGSEGVLLSAIKQLYVKYQPIEKLGITFGNFSTHVGYEVIDAKDNLNYSTSYLFSNGPFFHTGLKVNYDFTEKFGAMVGVFNDTDSKLEYVNGKHIGAQLYYSDDKTGLFLNYITGSVDTDGDLTSDANSSQVDLTLSFQAMEAFGLGLNTSLKSITTDLENQSKSWFGTALYANYTFDKVFTLAARGEYIIDNDGLILGLADNNISSFTLSGNFNLNGLVVIPEFRIDTGKEMGSFVDGDLVNSEQLASFIVGLHYSF